jgi:hypothetical protein
MKISVGVLDHYNVSTRKLDETVNFYENVLGFTNGPRWRPVLKQLPPPRSKKLAAEIDPTLPWGSCFCCDAQGSCK